MMGNIYGHDCEAFLPGLSRYAVSLKTAKNFLSQQKDTLLQWDLTALDMRAGLEVW
jgi:hypothetical protein